MSRAFGTPFEYSSPGDPQLFHYTPASLKEITAFKLAIELWYASFLREDQPVLLASEIYEAFDDERKIRECQNYREILTSLENQSLPGQIKNLIKYTFKTVCDRISTWLRLERDLMIFDSSDDFSFSYSKLRRYLRCLTWEPNGEINYEKTAKKLLSEINSMAIKCKIMCKYCFEDEIRNISPEDLQYWPNNRLGSYWKNTLTNGTVSLDHLYSVTTNDICTRSALEYLWGNLANDERRIRLISNLLISNRIVRKYQKHLFIKMTELERYEIIAHISANIIINFWFHCSELELAFAIWIRIKDQINDSVFLSLIRGAVLNHRVNSSLEEDASMLIEIWRTAPDDLRNYILNTDVHLVKIIEAYFTPVSLPSPGPRNMKFLLLVLSSIDVDRRIKIIIGRGLDLIMNNDVDSARDVIQFCLDSCDDATKLYLKRSLLGSSCFSNYCQHLINDGDFKRLTALFELFPPELDSGTEYRKNLIYFYKTERQQKYIFQAEEWKNACDFIDRTYREEPHIATEVKKKFILGFSTSCSSYYPPKTTQRNGFWYSKSYLNEMTSVVENFLSDEETTTFKRNLLLDFFGKTVSKLFWLDFEPDVFHEFESWFLDTEDNIFKFKLLLPIDDIFDEIFTDECHDFDGYPECPAENIVAAENFLKWYFATVQEIKEYKLRRIHNFEEDDALREFFKIYRNENGYYSTLEVALLWFFDGDEDQILKFKSDRCNDALSEMIRVPVEVHDYRLLAFQCRIRRKMHEYSRDSYVGPSD